jgi:[ribosomal protein S5]-alanine N-acetyltransferase
VTPVANTTPLPHLRTARLLLRPFRLSDAADVQRLAGDKAVADMVLNIPHPYPDGVAEKWISSHQGQFEAGEACTLAVTLAKTGEFIGSVSLIISRRFDRAEAGYWIGVPYWNMGYCTEAARAILDYGFSVFALNRIHATHQARNPASGRVMVKLGMTHEGVARRHAKKGDRYEDMVLYGILAEEWREIAEEKRG